MFVHQTSRLSLETWELEDFDLFAPIARDPEVMHFIAEGTPWPDSRIGWFLGQQQAFQQTLGYCNWKLVERSNGALIGFCGMSPLRSVGEIEIGWWLRRDRWHLGFASEAARKVIEVAHADHGINQLVARAYRDNLRSIGIMEKLGMRFDRNLGTGAMGDIQLYRKQLLD